MIVRYYRYISNPTYFLNDRLSFSLDAGISFWESERNVGHGELAEVIYEDTSSGKAVRVYPDIYYLTEKELIILKLKSSS